MTGPESGLRLRLFGAVGDIAVPGLTRDMIVDAIERVVEEAKQKALPT